MDVVLPYAFGALAYYFTQSESKKENVMKGGNTKDMVRIPALIALTNVYMMESSDRIKNFRMKGGGKRKYESDEDSGNKPYRKNFKLAPASFSVDNSENFKLPPAVDNSDNFKLAPASFSITNRNDNDQKDIGLEHSSSEEYNESKESEEPKEVDNRPTHTTELYEAVYNILQFADAKHDFKELWTELDDYHNRMLKRFNIKDSIKVLGEKYPFIEKCLRSKSKFESNLFNTLIRYSELFFNEASKQRLKDFFFQGFVTYGFQEIPSKKSRKTKRKQFQEDLKKLKNEGIMHVVKDAGGVRSLQFSEKIPRGFKFIRPINQIWDSQKGSVESYIQNLTSHKNIEKSYFDTSSCDPKLLDDARNVRKNSGIPHFGIHTIVKKNLDGSTHYKNDEVIALDFCDSTVKTFSRIGKRDFQFSPKKDIIEQFILFLERQKRKKKSQFINWKSFIIEFKKWSHQKYRSRIKCFKSMKPFIEFVRDDIGNNHHITYEDFVMLSFDLKKTGDWGQVFWVKNNKSDTLFYSGDRLAALFSICCGNCTIGGFTDLEDPQHPNEERYAFIYRGHGFTNGDPAPFLSKMDGVRDYEQQISYLKHSMFLKRGRKDQFKPSVTAKDARLKREAKNEEIRKQRKENRLQKRRMMDRYGQRGRGREPVIIQRRIAHDHHGMKADHISEWEEVSSHLQKNMKAIYTRLEHIRNDSRRSESALTHDDIVFFEGMYVLFNNMPYIFNLIPAFGKAFDVENTVIASDVRDVKIEVLKYVFSLPNEIQNQWSKEFQTHGEAFYDAWAEKIGSICDEIYSAVYAD